MSASRIIFGVVALLVLGAAAAYIYARSQIPRAELAVGYGARVACGCRFIGNRPLDNCKKDFEPGMELVRLSEDAKAKSVTASIPLLASRTATFDPLLGCQPETYRD